MSGTARATRLIGHAGPVYSVLCTRCGRFVISGNKDGCVRLSTFFREVQDRFCCISWTQPSNLGSALLSARSLLCKCWTRPRSSNLCNSPSLSIANLCGELAGVDTVRRHPNCNGSSDRTARLRDIPAGNASVCSKRVARYTHLHFHKMELDLQWPVMTRLLMFWICEGRRSVPDSLHTQAQFVRLSIPRREQCWRVCSQTSRWLKSK